MSVDKPTEYRLKNGFVKKDICILPTEFDILKTCALPELKKDKVEYLQQNSALSH